MTISVDLGISFPATFLQKVSRLIKTEKKLLVRVNVCVCLSVSSSLHFNKSYLAFWLSASSCAPFIRWTAAPFLDPTPCSPGGDSRDGADRDEDAVISEAAVEVRDLVKVFRTLTGEDKVAVDHLNLKVRHTAFTVSEAFPDVLFQGFACFMRCDKMACRINNVIYHVCRFGA